MNESLLKIDDSSDHEQSRINSAIYKNQVKSECDQSNIMIKIKKTRVLQKFDTQDSKVPDYLTGNLSDLDRQRIKVANIDLLIEYYEELNLRTQQGAQKKLTFNLEFILQMMFRKLIIYDSRIKSIGTRQLDLLINCQPDVPNWIRKAGIYIKSIFSSSRRLDSAYYLKYKQNLTVFRQAAMIELNTKAIKNKINLNEQMSRNELYFSQLKSKFASNESYQFQQLKIFDNITDVLQLKPKLTVKNQIGKRQNISNSTLKLLISRPRQIKQRILAPQNLSNQAESIQNIVETQFIKAKVNQPYKSKIIQQIDQQSSQIYNKFNDLSNMVKPADKVANIETNPFLNSDQGMLMNLQDDSDIKIKFHIHPTSP